MPVGGSLEIYFSILDGTEWLPSEQLTSNSLPDRQPHLAFTSQGDRRAAWWRDDTTDVVLYSAKAASGGSWSSPVQVSDGSEDARAPRVAVSGSTVLVVYEGVPSSGNRKVIVAKGDDPNPWARIQITVSSLTATLSVRIHKDSGHLWVDWVDSTANLGWSEYATGSWSSPGYEGYSGESDIEAGRVRIRSTVLGQ